MTYSCMMTSAPDFRRAVTLLLMAKGIASDPAARAALVKSGERAFRAKGYEAASMREIASAAGVNVAVAMREFGGKSGLFRAATIEGFALGDALRGARPLWGAALVDLALTGGFAAYPPAALSTGSETAERLLREGFQARLVAPLAERLGGGDAEARARLILAILGGLAFGRSSFGMAAGGEEASRTAAYVQDLVNG